MLKHYFSPRLKIFSLSSNRPLAEKVADAVDVELGKCSITRFSDGEIQVNIEESIRSVHVHVTQPTNSPTNNNLMELLITINALKRASAKTVSMVMPYCGYAHQDRKTRAREPITARPVANMIEKTGATRVLTLDLRAVQIQKFFDIPVDHSMGAPLVADYFIEHDVQGDDIVIVSPDHGGITHARKLAKSLKAPTVIIDKRRPETDIAEVMDIIDHMGGKTCVLIDDMIDTAGIISLAANALEEVGTKNVYAPCAHPVLSGPASQCIRDLAIERLVVTDPIYLPDDRRIAEIDEVSIGGLVGDAIKRIHEDRPVSPLFETKSK